MYCEKIHDLCDFILKYLKFLVNFINTVFFKRMCILCLFEYVHQVNFIIKQIKPSVAVVFFLCSNCFLLMYWHRCVIYSGFRVGTWYINMN